MVPRHDLEHDDGAFADHLREKQGRVQPPPALAHFQMPQTKERFPCRICSRPGHFSHYVMEPCEDCKVEIAKWDGDSAA